MEPKPSEIPTRPDAASFAGQRRQELTLLEAARIVLEYRRLAFGIPAGLATLVVVVSLLSSRTYSVLASFVPQATPSVLSGLAGLAGQYGVALPGTDQSESPEFYAALLTSAQVLRGVVESNYDFVSGSDTLRGNLIALFNIRKTPLERGREEAVKNLRDNITVSIGLKTGVVSLIVRARYAPLALAITKRTLKGVNDFNLLSRQSQASAQRAFVERRVLSTAEDLRLAEDSLQGFLQRNRNFRGAPQLSFQHDRLQREIAMRQGVYTSLMQALEQSKIDEVRNTPVITMVEQPILPAKPDSRLISLKVSLSLILGALIGVGAAFLSKFLGGNSDLETAERDDFVTLLRETWADLRRPWRFLSRR